MPLISFTPADRMLTTIIKESGWKPAIISEIDGPKASTSGKSVNFFVIFRITEGDFKGKELTIAFTSGSKQASVLGGMMWMPTAFLQSVIAAIENIPVEQVPNDYDTDKLMNRPLDINILAQVVDGAFINTISGFLPLGVGQASKVPF